MNATQSPEEWRPVHGYKGFYEVSSRGRVRSIDRFVGRRFWPGKPISLASHTFGYPMAPLNKRGNKRIVCVHILVLEAFAGPRPLGAEACHRNGNPSDNRLENLYWGSHADNMKDMTQHGTHRNTAKTECIRGHEFSASNTYLSPDGKRYCRTCLLAAAARFRQENRDKINAEQRRRRELKRRERVAYE